MANASPGTGSPGADIDLSQFYQVFFEEAGENLDDMEQRLLQIDLNAADDEELNAIFRCAHSVKGGAATFGFSDVAELTHEMETLLDKLRRHELQPTPPMIDVLLASGDALKSQLARHQGQGNAAPDTTELLRAIRAHANGETPPPAGSAATAPAAPAVKVEDGTRELELTVGPLQDMAHADNLLELFREIEGLGTIEALDAGQGADGMRRYKIVSAASESDLLDLFTFHISRECMQLGPIGQGYGFHRDAPGAPPMVSPDASDGSYGFFDDAPGAPDMVVASEAPIAPLRVSPDPVAPAAPVRSTAAAAPARTEVKAAADTTLRVSVEKVDQLINLVGELVITQAMLAQTSKGVDPALVQQMAAGLGDLERNTRDLQEAVMSIRMIPMSLIFNRFPRMLRDLAGKLGKKVELVTQGEATELDKGLVEKITDPLTHLVRNSCDHGIELPAERLARGKPAHGTITLAASHQGGSIVIEVRDDGRGLNRDKLIKKARERGIDAPDSMSDSDAWGLIFAPGFSTAEAVTDVSGRGVGMDVVKKNISSLGGTVEIDSAEGYGMSVRVRLPLTLAIMDGMSVGVAEECYILPLGSVVESFQIQADTIRTIGGTGRVVQVREEYMPVVDLQQVFEIPREDPTRRSDIMVIVESDGRRVALLVDELLGQQQVVVKNLETNYRRVDDVSGATIMGDGRVALILDIGALVNRSRH